MTKLHLWGPPLLFGLLSAAFLWQPLLTGQVLLPTDLSFRYDYLWKALEAEPGRVVAQNPLLSDVADQFYPYAVYTQRQLRAGQFPLWNPYLLTGTPFFAAAQPAVLDPINVLSLAVGPYARWVWAAWLRLALLGWFMYGFLRALGRSPAAGLLAGAAFMICGFAVVWLNYSLTTTLVWMPALFWATTRLLHTGRPAWLAATAAALGLVLLGGHPETAFVIGLTWGLYVLYSLGVIVPRQSLRPRALQLGSATLLGLALGAVQWLTFSDLLLRSDALTARKGPVPPFDPGETALRLAVLFFPNAGGTPLAGTYWVPAFTNFNEQTGYYGLLAVGLAMVGAVAGARRDRPARFFAGLAVLALLLAIRAPGFHLIKALPLFDVGHGVRWVITWSFCGAVLAGYGVDALLAARPGQAALRRVGLALAGATVAGAGGGLGVYLGIRLAGWDRSWGAALPHDDMVTLFHPLRLAMYWPLVFLGLGAGLVLARWRGWLRGPALAAGLILLVYADLWTFGSRYNPVTPADAIFPRTATIRYLEEHLGHERLVGVLNLLRPNVSLVFGFRDLRGYEHTVDAAFARLYQPLLQQALDITGRDSLDLTPEQHRLLQIAGVRYVLTVRKLRVAGDPGPYQNVFEADRVATYEDREALPRAYVVYSATVTSDLPAATATLLAPTYDPRRAVVLTGGGRVLAGPDLDAGATPIRWWQDAPEAVEVEATLAAPGYLVLADNYAPGWEATVDGQPAALLRANVVYRAVALPPGPHRVAFHYRPWLFYSSAGISAVAALTILGLALGAWQRLRRGKRPAA
jgi:hypothetical protein